MSGEKMSVEMMSGEKMSVRSYMSDELECMSQHLWELSDAPLSRLNYSIGWLEASAKLGYDCCFSIGDLIRLLKDIDGNDIS